MELAPSTATVYVRHAFAEMLDVVDRLGDGKINLRPHGASTNSVAALVVHCCEVTEFWLGHVCLGRPSDRDRDAEFSATAEAAELHERVYATVAVAEKDLEEIAAGRTTPGNPARLFMAGADPSDAAVIFHVVEELFQHLGHMELTADALAVCPPSM